MCNYNFLVLITVASAPVLSVIVESRETVQGERRYAQYFINHPSLRSTQNIERVSGDVDSFQNSKVCYKGAINAYTIVLQGGVHR